MKKLTIIIINYNTKDLLIKCINSIGIEKLPRDYHLCVVDNNSPDGSAAVVRKRFIGVELIALNENKGFPFAANLGIKKHPSEFYLILNSDTEMNQRNIDEMLRFMSDNPDVGAMTPFQFNNRNEPQLAWGVFPTFSSEIGRKILQNSLDSRREWALRKIRKIQKPFYVHWVAGSTMLLRDSALQKTGLFDENFFIFFEDIDLCKRICDAGWKIAVNPDIKVIHHRGEAAKTDSLNASLHYRRSQAYFWKKHHHRLSCQFMRQYLISKYSLELVKYRIKSLFKKTLNTQLKNEKEDLEQTIKVIKKSFKG